MSKPNPYAFISVSSALVFRKKMEAEEKAAQRSRLTVVTTDMDNNMDTTEEQPVEPFATTPLHKHGAFYDMEAAINFLALGAEALKGIGTIMEPISNSGDEEVQIKRSEISTIFQFFGEALREPASIASDAAQRLELASLRGDA